MLLKFKSETNILNTYLEADHIYLDHLGPKAANSAAFQKLFFRYLTYIGDSLPHRILMQKRIIIRLEV